MKYILKAIAPLSGVHKDEANVAINALTFRNIFNANGAACVSYTNNLEV
jgi:hypothetical protein